MWGQQAIKKIISVLGILAAILCINGSVFAMPAAPEFPSCLTPSGEMKANYESGIHGIVGDSNKYEGRDTVYLTSDYNAYQCFCPPSGNGIQTNWWMIGDMKQHDIDTYTKQGWIYAPTGSVWGLKNKAYLAKNVSFSCLGNKPTETSTSTPGGSSNSGSGSSGSSSSGSSSNGGGSSLASTGSLVSIYQTAMIGALFALGGAMIRRGIRS